MSDSNAQLELARLVSLPRPGTPVQVPQPATITPQQAAIYKQILQAGKVRQGP